MTSIGTLPTPPPPALHESSIHNVSSIIGQSGGQNVPIIGQSVGPSYQPTKYHPHAFNPYYNQAISYNYNMQPNMHTSPAPEGPFMLSFALTPTPTHRSDPSLIPTPVPVATPSEEPERKSPVLNQGPRCPCKQPTGETVPDQKVPCAPAQKGHLRGSQSWSAQDLFTLTHYVEEAISLGMNVWKQIEGLYNNEYTIPNNQQQCTWDHMQEKWYRIVSNSPPTGTGEIPDAINKVFQMNNKMEDIGGLVDPEDHPEGGSGQLGLRWGRRCSTCKKRFVTSFPGTDSGSIGSSAGGSTSQQMKHGSALLAEKLLSSISPDAEACQNDNRAIQCLYLQQICALEEMVHVQELQINTLLQEVTNLQEKLQTTTT
ncbi:hypothetical protein EDB86DRAFT_2830073 [Lactarius hatsudake]|nr:hypothetical protein EDB86DRAFT_2830073 [Lactarius hatsudake]